MLNIIFHKLAAQLMPSTRYGQSCKLIPIITEKKHRFVPDSLVSMIRYFVLDTTRPCTIQLAKFGMVRDNVIIPLKLVLHWTALTVTQSCQHSTIAAV